MFPKKLERGEHHCLKMIRFSIDLSLCDPLKYILLTVSVLSIH